MNDYNKLRVKALAVVMNKLALDAVLLSSPAYVYYFCGILPGKYNYTGLLAGKNGELVLITAAGEAPESFDGNVVTYEEYSVDALVNPPLSAAYVLAKTLSEESLQNIGIDADCLTARLYQITASVVENVIDITDEIQEMTVVKDDFEVGLIKKSIALCDLVHGAVAGFIRPGITELELWSTIQKELNVQAGEPIEFICDCVTGERTVDIGGKPSSRVLQEGDLVIVDILPYFNGYYGDTTRTFVVGEATAKQKEVYEVLKLAMAAGEQLLRAGTMARDIYAAVKAVIADSGYGDHFPHHAGHGFGLNFFESPLFIPASLDILKAGSIVTLEPGIYLPGLGGMRLENNYLITAEGYKVLSQYSNELKECK